MYCGDGHGTDIEHFRPKAEYPLAAFDWANHLLACSYCNSNQKRDRFPLDEHGEPLLLDPTTDDPRNHLALSSATGRFVGLDHRGSATIDICGLNRQVCVAGRVDAWVALEQLVVSYERLRDTGRDVEADRLLRAISRQPFQSVRMHMVAAARSASPRLLLGVEVVRAFERFPELSSDVDPWV